MPKYIWVIAIVAGWLLGYVTFGTPEKEKLSEAYFADNWVKLPHSYIKQEVSPLVNYYTLFVTGMVLVILMV